jgi:hypothetical protein
MTAGFETGPGISTGDVIIADHFGKVWRDSLVPTETLVEDWLDLTVEFIAVARAGGSFLSFFARRGSDVVGSLAVQQFLGLSQTSFRAIMGVTAMSGGLCLS